MDGLTDFKYQPVLNRLDLKKFLGPRYKSSLFIMHVSDPVSPRHLPWHKIQLSSSARFRLDCAEMGGTESSLDESHERAPESSLLNPAWCVRRESSSPVKKAWLTARRPAWTTKQYPAQTSGEPGVRSMLVNNYMMAPRRVGATAGARARHENMNRAPWSAPGECFTFEDFQSDGQSGWTCSESFLYESAGVDPKATGQLTSRSDAVSIHCTPRGMPDFAHSASLGKCERPHNPREFRWQEHTRRPSSAWPAAQQPANGFQALGREHAAMAPEIGSPKNALAAQQGGLYGGLNELQQKYEESLVDQERLPVAGTAHAGFQEMIVESKGRANLSLFLPPSLPPSPPATPHGKRNAELPGTHMQPMCGQCSASHAQPLQTDLDQRIATTLTDVVLGANGRVVVSRSVPATQSRPVVRSRRGGQGSREAEEAAPARGELDAERLPAKLLRTVGPPGPTPDSESEEDEEVAGKKWCNVLAQIPPNVQKGRRKSITEVEIRSTLSISSHGKFQAVALV
jgi:hypothetical protein